MQRSSYKINNQNQGPSKANLLSHFITCANILDRYYWIIYNLYVPIHRVIWFCDITSINKDLLCMLELWRYYTWFGVHFNQFKMVLLPPCSAETCGKDFRHSLKKPSPNYVYGYRTRKPRLVPAFTIQAMQRNTKVLPPVKSNVFDALPPKPTMFRKCYLRGEFPVSIEFTNFGKRLAWKVRFLRPLLKIQTFVS